MTYLLIFFTSLITTIFITPYFISFLKKSKIVDYPGGRKIHSGVMPRMGGLVIFLIVIIMLNAFVEDFSSIKLLIISATILIFSGIVDDVIGLNNFIKFVIQNVSAVLLIFYLEQYYTGVTLFGIDLTSPWNYLALLLLIVGAINSINFLDGLDGLASGFALLIFSVLLVLAIRKNDVFLILLSVTLLGSTLGFLRFNAFPASIFLGDTGSLMLGFFLIMLTSMTSINYHESVLDLTFPLIILGVPLVDTVKVFILRIIRRRDPFSGDTSHQHHMLKKSIVSYEATIFIIEIFSLFYIFIGLLYLIDYRIEAIILFFFFSILLVSLHPLLSRTNVAEVLNRILVRLHDIPIKNLRLLIKSSLIISSVFLIVVALLSISTTTSLELKELLLLLLLIFGLFVISVIRFRKFGTCSEMNVLFNMTIFFIISKLSLTSIISDELTYLIITRIHEWAFYILTFIISVTLILRWKSLMTHKMFITGTDLTIIVFMLLTFIVNNIFHFDLNYYLSVSLLEAFIIYLWYKLVVDFNQNFERKLSIVSFILPTLHIIILIWGSAVGF